MGKKFDAIVIGTGQSGPSLAAKMASKGWEVAIIEKDKFGGTCVNTGCTPTKTMVASAKVAHVTRQAADYGVFINGDIKVDLKRVKERKDELVSASTKGLEDWLKSTKGITVFEGHARFISNKAVEVNEEVLEAENIFINVGGKPRMPSGYERINVLTNREILELEKLPEHLIVIGGSYIGLEFGQMFRRFGSKVTIIERKDRLINKEDSDVSHEVESFLEGEGITLRLEAECLDGVPYKDDKILVNVDCKKGDRQVIGSHLLLAVGREPNTDDLGLSNTSIQVDDRGYITVNENLETSIQGVWAIGDCNGKGGFTHTSYNDFEIVADQLFGSKTRKVSDRIPCYALYTDPPLARIGIDENQAKKSEKDILISKRSMSRIARAKEKGETSGFMKILVERKSQKILGATILGVDGDEIIHSILDVMYANKPYTTISRAVHIHPTISELIPTILQELEPLIRVNH